MGSLRDSRFVEFITTAGYLGGGSVVLAIILFAIATWEHFKDHNVSPGLLAALGVVFFCFGAYWAWSKERDKFEAERNKNESPDFVIDITSIMAYFNPNSNTTCICVAATILNRGVDSAALHWRGCYASPSISSTIWAMTIADPEFWWPPVAGYYLVMSKSDLLTARTSQVLAKGNSASGRLLFHFQGNLMYEIERGVAQLTLACEDFKGKPYEKATQIFDQKEMISFPHERLVAVVIPSDFTLPESISDTPKLEPPKA